MHCPHIVSVIFTAGIVIAGTYLILASPGEHDDKPVWEVLDPNS